MKKVNLQTMPLWAIIVTLVCMIVGGFTIDYFLIDFLFGDYFPKEDKMSIIISIQAYTFYRLALSNSYSKK